MAIAPGETQQDDAPDTPPANTGPLKFFNALNSTQKMMVLGGIAAAIAILVGIALWSRGPEYKVLFSNLSEQDGGSIITSLQQMNVPYKFSEGGGAILVPAEQVHDVRLRLASQGLPKGGLVGFELMENQKFGISQFHEQINYQRGLEGELARSIRALAAVQNARVHLAIPKPSVFVREEQKPSASVLLTLHPGRSLEAAQIAGITHLVASSVPQLATANVTIVDQTGALLSKRNSQLEALLDPTQIKYTHEVEKGYISRIQNILAPMVGADNLRAQVTAEVDFSQAEQTAEIYKPNSTPGEATLRSQQSSESATNQSSPQGVPGALSNQPPQQAAAPIVAQGGQTGPAAQAQPSNVRKDATINYEVDRTIRHVKQNVGSVKRLSVAVVVNYRKEAGKDGKLVPKPLTEAELKQIGDLVREAVGYNKDRGDTLNVTNSPFTPEEKLEIEIPFWKDPETVALIRELIKWLVIAGVIYVFYAKFIRTWWMDYQRRRAEEEAARLAAMEAEQDIYTMPLPKISYEQKLDRARMLAKDNPKLIAGIIKSWLG